MGREELDIDGIVSQMTLEEKIGFVHGAGLFRNEGAERFGIPPIIMSDGPLGVRFDFEDAQWRRKNEHTCSVSWLISGVALASTWNEELAYMVGDILGMEARGRGKDVILAPGVNIHRTPLCGRNFEYMSEDPYLAGKLAAKEIQGIQANDVAACVKHFALNNQETNRMEVNAEVGDRALYELYFPAFYEAVTCGNAFSIMCSYNRFRGDYVSDSKYLLTDVLRDKWNYDGVVISDWSAVHSTKKSFEAGVDIDMGVAYNFDDYYFAGPLLEAIKNGEVSEELLDIKVKRIITLLKRVKKIGPDKEKRSAGAYNLTETHEKLHTAASEAVVLLKNEGILPVQLNNIKTNNIKKIAVIGDAATRKLALGGGSSEIDALFEITPLMGINMVYGSSAEVLYAPGYYVDNEENTAGDVNWQADSLDVVSDGNAGGGDLNNVNDKHAKKKNELLSEAVNLAKECDMVIFVGGLNRSHDTEGFDRTSYKLPYNQNEVITKLLEIKPNMIIAINSGSAIDMSSFADKAKAILWSSMNGMMGGQVLAEVMAGIINPSGKTPVSFPRTFDECPAQNMDGNYDEELMVGYRYYTTKGIKPLFDFGHGLSYTEYEYKDIKINKPEIGKSIYEVSCTIKNTGAYLGKETVQLYIEPINSRVFRPKIELKGFKKLPLKPGEECKAVFVLDEKSFSYYDEEKGSFVTDAGEYAVHIGASCTDIRLSGKIEI